MKTLNIPCPITQQQLPQSSSRLQIYSQHQSSPILQSMAPQSTTFNTFLRGEQQSHSQQQQPQQQQSIYPSSLTPSAHECETNLKSDFVKYLLHRNQFPGTHDDKYNFVDNTSSILLQQQQPPTLPQSSSSYSHLYRFPMTNENLLQTTCNISKYVFVLE